MTLVLWYWDFLSIWHECLENSLLWGSWKMTTEQITFAAIWSDSLERNKCCFWRAKIRYTCLFGLLFVRSWLHFSHFSHFISSNFTFTTFFFFFLSVCFDFQFDVKTCRARTLKTCCDTKIGQKATKNATDLWGNSLYYWWPKMMKGNLDTYNRLRFISKMLINFHIC